jgi:acetoin utilization deacetylase AcuC-like enzyme
VNKAPVQWVYSDRYNLDLSFPTADALRSQRLLSYLEREGILRSGDLHRARRTSMGHLLRVHDIEYLRKLETAEGVGRVFGVPIQPAQVDELLLWQRAMVGGTILSARLALRDGITLFNLGGGLHHARPDRGQGYCLFNDVAVAVEFLRRRWLFRERILVVDLDVHDGDGTRAFFRDDATVHTFSIHNRTLLDPGDAVEDTCIELGTGVTDDVYLECVERELPRLVERFRPELVFYLAGADVAHDDRHGDWEISEAGVLERDRFVMETLRPEGSDRAVVVLLAGGYGQNAWRYSARFASWLTLGRTVEPPATQNLPLAAWRKIVSRLSEPLPEPTRDREEDPDDWGLTAEDLPGPMVATRSSLLGRFSVHAVELALERLGLMHRLRRLGYEHLKVEADLDHPLGQGLRVVSVAPERRVLFELRGRIEAELVPGFRTLFVEWMLSQDPGAEFRAKRPGLPGQEAPGLNILGDVASLLILGTEHLELDAMSFIPTHFSLVLQSWSHVRCVDPVRQGETEAVMELLDSRDFLRSLDQVMAGEIRHRESGEPWRWEPTAVCVPVSEPLKKWFASPEYLESASRARNAASFHLVERSDG